MLPVAGFASAGALVSSCCCDFALDAAFRCCVYVYIQVWIIIVESDEHIYLQLKQQETPDGRWLCPDCTAGLQRCKLCGEVGPVGSGSLDDSDDEKPVKEKPVQPEVDEKVKAEA